MNQPSPSPDLPHLLRVARNQRAIMLCILAQLGIAIAGFTLALSPLVRSGLSLVVGIASLVFTVALARLLFSAVGVGVCILLLLTPFASFVAPNAAGMLPLVSLLTLLVVNQRATKALQGAGFRVGLLGGDPADVEARMRSGAG